METLKAFVADSLVVVPSALLFECGEILRARSLAAKPWGRPHLGNCRLFLLVVSVCAVLLAAVRPAHATFPGSNGRIAFASERDGDFEIYTMNPDGTGVAQLTNNVASDRYPAWSSGGTMIAFSSNRDGDDDIYVMCADGTGQTQLTFNTFADYQPTWSPDGTKIAFISSQDGDPEIYVMNADGTGRIQLTFNTIADSTPAWSPDGTRISFMKGASHTNEEIWMMNADGTGQTQLTSNGIQDTIPRWAPDSSKLLFRRELAYGSGWAELFTINSDGRGESQLTFTATIYEAEGTYSPDGTQIVLNHNRDDPAFDIYLFGGTRLTNSPGQDSDLDWQTIVVTVPVQAEVSPPGATIPFTVANSAPDQLEMAWQAACGAATYRIVSGSLSSLQPSGVTISNASPMVCGIVGTSISQPMPAGSVFLIVAGDNGVGTGPLGNASSGTPREASPTCP